jgi:hypothetical protein
VEGLEPPTSALRKARSIHLSYTGLLGSSGIRKTERASSGLRELAPSSAISCPRLLHFVLMYSLPAYDSPRQISLR